MVLPDVLKHDLRIVFCGMRVGSKSAQLQAYYAGSGNKFWKTLARIGLAPLLNPTEFINLPLHGIGLTDLIKGSSGGDCGSRISEEDISVLRAKISKYSPGVLAFNGKRVAKEFLGRDVFYGLQGEKIGNTQIYVLPSTSGAANGFWDITYWEELARLLR